MCVCVFTPPHLQPHLHCQFMLSKFHPPLFFHLISLSSPLPPLPPPPPPPATPPPPWWPASFTSAASGPCGLRSGVVGGQCALVRTLAVLL